MHSYKESQAHEYLMLSDKKKASRQLQYSTSFAARGTELQCDLCIHALHAPCTSSAMM